MTAASNWDDVRIFLAVCREGSVSRAGERLGISHTTVLRRVRQFEDGLGTRLFDRTQAGYSMTLAAEDLFGHAVQVEGEMLAIDRKILGRDSALAGSVRLTASSEVARILVAPELARFRASYPGINLVLVETMDLLNLDAREAELAVRLTASPPEGLIGRRAQPLVLGLYATASYMAERGADPEVIVYRREDITTGWVPDSFPGSRVALRADSSSTLLAAAVAGIGIARIPCFIADHEPRIRRLPIDLPADNWGVWILTHPDFRSNARVRATRDFLVTSFEEKRALFIGEESRYLGDR